MNASFDHIESFARFLGAGTRSKQLLFLNPNGEHRYLFKPTAEAVRMAASLVTGEGIKRTLGGYALYACSHIPLSASLIPRISRVSVRVPADRSFDVMMVSNRTRIFDFEDRTVRTIPTDEPYGIIKEIRARNDLPAEINTPRLYESDTDYPFFAEEFVRGRRPRSPINEWRVMRSALEQLYHIHKDSIRTVPTADLRNDIEHLLSERGLSDKEPFDTALNVLDDLALPRTVYVTKIHGDFHARNVLVDGEDVYILDWEMYRFDYSFRDFFKPFVISHYDTRDPSCMRGMIRGEGTGGQIYEDYVRRFGTVLCPAPEPYAGLPLLYLLLELARKTKGNLWDSYRELLDSLLSESLTRP